MSATVYYEKINLEKQKHFPLMAPEAFLGILRGAFADPFVIHPSDKSIAYIKGMLLATEDENFAKSFQIILNHLEAGNGIRIWPEY